MIERTVAPMPPDRAAKEVAMDLSKQDRLMLINQFRILEILDKDRDKAEDHSRHATILKEGFAGEYYDVFSGIAEELSREECQEVADTLLMYWELQRAHESARETISADEVRFPGYSGDSKDPEFRRSFYRKFFSLDSNNFSVLARSPDFKSSTSNVDVYRRMLTAWRDTDPINRLHLTPEQARAILNAGQEPEPGERSPVNFTVLPRRKDQPSPRTE